MPPNRMTLSSVTPSSVSVCPDATPSVPSWSVAYWMVLSVFTTEKAPSRSSVPPDRVTLSSAAKNSVSVCPDATVSVPFWSVA